MGAQLQKNCAYKCLQDCVAFSVNCFYAKADYSYCYDINTRIKTHIVACYHYHQLSDPIYLNKIESSAAKAYVKCQGKT